jgi:RNA polymerase sigma factor (sigma-70 family)
MSAGVLSYLRHLLPTAEAVISDGELLRRFAATREPTAFTELLLRHGPLVWGVCRRVLGNVPAAEDAFQATFLQLAQRAAALRRDAPLAGWLHTVAARLARRARLAEERRRRRERATRPATPAPADDLTWRELRQILDAEIARLPGPYRQPLILCYLENRPQAEAARRLGLAPAVLRGRLERGRQKLRRRLEKLGLPLASALLLAHTDSLPAALAQTTLQTVCSALAGEPVSPAVATLAAGTTLLTRVKIGLVAAALLVAVGVGIGGATRRAEPAVAPPLSAPRAARPSVDALGDPLPPGAILRLGTRRHRVQNGPLAWHGLPDGKSYLVYQRLGDVAEVRRFDAATGRAVESWPVPAKHHVVAFSPDGRHVLMSTNFIFYTGIRLPGEKETQEWVLALYDLAKRRVVWKNSEKLEQKDWKYVDQARFSADGKWVATTGRFGSGPLRLWDAATGKERWEHKQDQALDVLGFAEGGKALVVRRGSDNTISLFDRDTGKPRRSFPTMPPAQTQQCGLAPDGSAVLFGTQGPSVRAWDVATGKERSALGGHKQGARCFAFAPDGKTVVTGGNGPFALAHAWPSGKAVRTIGLGRGGVERLALSGDGGRLEVLFWGEQALHFYDLKTGKALPAPSEGHQAGVHGVALAPGGALVSFGKDATVRTWDVAAGKAVGRLSVEQDRNTGGLAVSRDGRLLATPSSDNAAVRVRERATGKLVRTLPAEPTVARHLVFSPDGRWLAGADSSSGIIQVWDVTRGGTVLRLRHKVVYGVTCAFSPDGRQFAATEHGRVRFWDVGTWKEHPGLAAYAPLGLAYSPDGRTLATASVEGVRLFELATHRERSHVRPDGYPRGALQFSPTGRWLAWTGSSRTIHVWDVHRGEMLGSFRGHDDAVTGLAFAADDRALASSSEDSTILVWDVAGPAAKKPPLKAGDVGPAWQALAGDDAKAAFQAIRVLASSPEAAVKRIARHLQPAAPLDPKRIDAYLRDLDSPRFADRERATRDLEQLGDQAAAALERFLAGRPSPEARRRAEQALAKARKPARDSGRLRQARALEALERIGGDGARRVLEALAKGAPDATLTRDAKVTLGRMRR